ncbi:winged helix DNA-binding domain-containing protein [Euzebya tangerina]|uniref:winged helix DNA-binding domain-containing protein n=1 Tax=Euzebya tangerina TaxID=591198 RepID=UPI0013C2F7E3|nr:winged helix DNA-binding domain-containing protein [Euzebya tangerina]
MRRPISDESRRALLAERQLLGGAASSGWGDRGVVDVAAAVGPLHSTDPSSAYLQIAARADVSPRDIDQALYEDRELLRHTTLRRTVHLLLPDVAAAAHGAYNYRMLPTLRGQLVKWLDACPDVKGDAAAWLAEVEDRVVAAVTDLDEPSGGDLSTAVPELGTVVEPAPGKSYGKPIRITSKVLEILIAEGRIARNRPRGEDWTSGAWSYAPVTGWIPDGLGTPDPEPSLAKLLTVRLTSLPAASVVDLAWWTGLPKGQVKTALATIEAEEVEREDGAVGYVLPEDDLTPVGHEPAAALLPGLDATPMGCKERDWFLGRLEDELFDRNGNIGPTVWWGGRIIGGWTQRTDGQVAVGYLEDVDAAVRRAVEDEAERLQAWIGEVRVNWRYPTPLQKRLEA